MERSKGERKEYGGGFLSYTVVSVRVRVITRCCRTEGGETTTLVTKDVSRRDRETRDSRCRTEDFGWTSMEHTTDRPH